MRLVGFARIVLKMRSWPIGSQGTTTPMNLYTSALVGPTMEVRQTTEKDMNDEQQRKQQFLVELTALTRKHGISIGGCGCCGSPWLDAEAEVSDQRAGYALCDNLKWVEPSDSYNWERYADGIIREGYNAALSGWPGKDKKETEK